MTLRLVSLKSKLKTKKFSYLLPFFYLLSLIISFAVSFSNLLYPVSLCPSFFGERACAPIGAYFALFVSVPGYIVVGALNSLLGGIAWYMSLFLVITISLAFYFLVGKLLDKLKTRSAISGNVVLITGVFFVLLVLLIAFLFLSYR
jgi:hypothetical protein